VFDSFLRKDFFPQTKLFQFSSILFGCMKKLYDGLAAPQCYLWRNSSFAS